MKRVFSGIIAPDMFKLKGFGQKSTIQPCMIKLYRSAQLRQIIPYKFMYYVNCLKRFIKVSYCEEQAIQPRISLRGEAGRDNYGI